VAVSTLVAFSKDQVKDVEYERSILLILQYQDRPTCLSRVSISSVSNTGGEILWNRDVVISAILRVILRR